MLSMRSAFASSTLSQRVRGNDGIAPDDETIASNADRRAGRPTGAAPQAILADWRRAAAQDRQAHEILRREPEDARRGKRDHSRAGG
jgi:hypothetical protein